MIDFTAFRDEVNKIKLAASSPKKEDNNLLTGAGMTAGGLGSAVVGVKRLLPKLDGESDEGELYQKLKQQAKAKGTEVFEDVPGYAASYVPDDLSAKVTGLQSGGVYVGGGGKRPSFLAHELGHASIGRNKLLKGLIQNTPTVVLAGLGTTPLVAIGTGVGSGSSDNETVREVGKWAPLIASVPQLASEAGASLIGLRNLRRLGMRGKAFREAGKDMLGGFATYAGKTSMGTGLAHLGSGVAQKRKQQQEQESVKKAYDEVSKIKLATKAEHLRLFREFDEKYSKPKRRAEMRGTGVGAVLGLLGGAAAAGKGRLKYVSKPLGAGSGAILGAAIGPVAGKALHRPSAEGKAADKALTDFYTKSAYAVSQYSGPLSYGGFKQESHIPPFRNPAMKVAGPPPSKEKKADWGEWAGDNEMQGTHFQQKSHIPAFKSPKLKVKKAYDPSPMKGPGTLGNVDVPGMRKMRTPAKGLAQSKGVADFKEVKPDASKALNIKLPSIGSSI